MFNDNSIAETLSKVIPERIRALFPNLNVNLIYEMQENRELIGLIIYLDRVPDGKMAILSGIVRNCVDELKFPFDETHQWVAVFVVDDTVVDSLSQDW